jgi:hypothetical protein
MAGCPICVLRTIFENRLHNEIIVDAYRPEEQAISWYYYLDEHLQFPFKALCGGAPGSAWASNAWQP